METILSTCPNCKAETIEGYDVCWNCNFSFSEKQVIDFVDVAPALGPCPKTWLFPAILVTLFCFLPTGLMAIYQASRVSDLHKAGDNEGAQEASNEAKGWVVISLILCALILLFYIIIK